MNQMSKVAAVDPVAQFVEDAGVRLRKLGYDTDLVQFECRAWRGNKAVWRFRPTIWNNKPALADIEAPTQAECLRLARAWLAKLNSEEATLAAVMGYDER